MSTHLSNEESLQELASRMTEPEDVIDYNNFRNSRVEACFEGRHFVIYRPQGLNSDNSHRDPEIITTLAISDYYCDGKTGARCTITDLQTDETQILTHVPARLFNYQVFAAIPTHCRIRWDARESDGKIKRSLIFSITLKTRNRSDHYSLGNTYCETPNQFRSLFPNTKLEPIYA